MNFLKNITGSASDQEVDPKSVDVVLVRRSSAGRAGKIFYGVPLDAYWQSKIAAGNAKILADPFGPVIDEPIEVFDNAEDFIASLKADIGFDGIEAELDRIDHESGEGDE